MSAEFTIIEQEFPARKIIKINNNNDDLPLVAGQTLKVETSPNGEEAIVQLCPKDKVWSTKVFVVITETDA